MCGFRWFCAVLVLAVCTATATLYAQTAWFEGFESPEISWRDAGASATYQILQHSRIQNDAHTGKGCEWLKVAAKDGCSLQLTHDVGRPGIIDELMPSVWVKSDRAGVQILARIVLPRTIDRQTGRALVTIVRGNSCTSAGRWQELRITDMPRLVAQQVRQLRSQLAMNVDGREAYLDAILLNIGCAPGITNLWIDDLDIAGYVPMPGRAQFNAHPATAKPAETASSGDWTPKQSNVHATDGLALQEQSLANQPRRHVVKLSGSVLTVDNRPFFPLAIEHQGEPLSLLKHLGFNT
ncbi:MAG: hypothetical protein ACWGMZ_13160, partial [Thermoguttaceae bacterium]